MPDAYEEIDAIINTLPAPEPVAGALGRRFDATSREDDLRWLDGFITSGPNQPQAPQAAMPEQAGGSTPRIMIRPEGAKSLAGRVAADVARGATEAPRQILGGMRDAAQAAIDLGDWLADSLEEIAPLGGVRVFDEQGNFAPGYVPAGDPSLAPDKTGGELPAVKEATTTTGGVVRGVAQFLTGFAGAGAAMGAAAKGAPLARAALQGGLADFTAFDGQQQRLSNLIEQVPALANPVTDYLAADAGDGEIEGRFKNALEGLGLGAMTEGLFRAVRYVRDGQRAARTAGPETMAARAEAAPPEARPLDLLGDEAAPLLAKAEGPSPEIPAGTPSAADIKLTSADRVAGDLGVPADVAARGVAGRARDARQAGAPAAPVKGEPSTYINFARINADADVKQVMADLADAFKGDIDAARRGVRTNDATLRAAGSVDAWQTLAGRRTGEPLNAEQSVAARRLWEASAAKLMEVADAASLTPTPENLYQFRKMMAVHHAVQREVIAARTETARALQSWAIPVGGGGAERLRAIENVLASHGGTEAAQALAQRVAALSRVPGGIGVLDDVVEKGVLSRSLDTAKEVWINALLSNPKTHMVNMLSNASVLGIGMVERAAAARWSQAIGSGDILPGEAAALAYGSAMSMREAFRAFWLALKTGNSAFGAATTKVGDVGFDRAVSAANWRISPDNWMGKAVDGLGAFANLPTRFLGAEDDFFKTIGYRGEVHAQAFRQAAEEVRAGALTQKDFKARVAALAADPPENIRLAAVDAALYQTFTSKPGVVIGAINGLDRRLATGSPGARLSSFALRMLMPFRNTPANIMKFAFERTPLAPLMASYREAVARGGADADIARTRMALGSMTLLAVMDLAFDGHISGGGPRNDRKRGTRDAMERSGWQPYSIRLGNTWVSYKRTDPIGMTFGLAADIAEIVNNGDLDDDAAEDLTEAMAGAAAAFGAQVLDKTYMSGIAGFMDALQNPNKSAGFVERLGASFVPAVAGEVRRQLDPAMRYTHDLTTQLKNRTPGLSEELPQARDLWGRPRMYQSGMGTVYDALSPLQARTFDPEPIDREAVAHDFNLSMPQWDISGVKLRNRPEVYTRLLEVRGQMKPSEMGAGGRKLVAKFGDQALLPLLNDIVEGRHKLSAKYRDATPGSDGGKDDLVSDIVRAYGRAAREVVKGEFPGVFGD
ncbi:hypothetical protein KHC23_07775 [Ancylobacter dichloromethanicus]|uniref:Uncharacterized protein n=1 Tax=Ancylobacter dichloromethanicus TaxID=518825 RepID=A0A9W6JB52_9HYPH|nr:hypothetical protein [Ancylobacter dichloromethanicus]MBS7553545.1 hypothetical protein [Ancylobacter dichloromethanicus]GLK72604.1 hypothetical protein GCM10017643_27200 [Ancylobacter dichloromethanicus]